MSSLYKLLLKTNIKSPALAFPLVMPLIFLFLYSTGINNEMSADVVAGLVATYYTTILAVMSMQSGLLGFGLNFIRIKKSVLIRRIGATELSKLDVVLAVVLFGLTLWFIAFVWINLLFPILVLIGVFQSSNHIGAFAWTSHIAWGKLILATLMMVYASFGLGLFFTTVARDDQAFTGMAMMYFFFAGFIGGIMFPGQIPTWMEWVGYLIPHAYIANLFDWASGSSIGDDIAVWEFSLSVIIPIVFGTLMVGLSAKKLKFD